MRWRHVFNILSPMAIIKGLILLLYYIFNDTFPHNIYLNTLVTSYSYRAQVQSTIEYYFILF